ncbi:hypothetical protein [Streptomyces decoyicus]|uniref:hypothetical protein n=1 Tax=Streptomyces decoyicus TaxID=249567 RepID=UPI0033BDF6F4
MRLRLISAPAEQATGKLWEGSKDPVVALPQVRKPALYGIHDAPPTAPNSPPNIGSPTCAPEPVLTGD